MASNLNILNDSHCCFILKVHGRRTVDDVKDIASGSRSHKPDNPFVELIRGIEVGLTRVNIVNKYEHEPDLGA